MWRNREGFGKGVGGNVYTISGLLRFVMFFCNPISNNNRFGFTGGFINDGLVKLDNFGKICVALLCSGMDDKGKT